MPKNTLLYAILFASGFAGLGYELVWTRMLAVGLGHEISAALAVVAAFFCGLALGAWALDRGRASTAPPGWLYTILESVIGLWAAALIFLIPWTNRLLAVIMGPEPTPGWQWLTAFLFPFLLFFPATFAMGGTLPVMHRFLKAAGAKGRVIGGLYAVNTFGAVGGTLLVVLFLIPRFGYAFTLSILAAVNLYCALGAALLNRANQGEQKSSPRPIMIGNLPPPNLAWLLFVTGLLGIGYEVLVLRLISQVLENTVYTFAAVLAVYLLGTAGGAALYQRLAPRRPAVDPLPGLLTALAGLGLAGTLLLWHSPEIYQSLRAVFPQGIIPAMLGEIVLAAAVLVPPTLIMGAAFSHLAQKAEDGRIGLGKALGINTLGASLAPLLFGVLLLPLLGSKTTLIALSFGYLALVPLTTGRRFYIPAMIPFLGGLSLLFYPGPLRLVTLAPGEKILAHREGIMAAATVIQDDRGGTHLRINSRFQEGGTTSVYSDRRQGHIPLLLHPHPERVLFLGLGVGSTLAAAAEHPGLQAEGVELIPEVISLLPHFHQANGNLDRQSSIRLVQADARRYVQSRPGTYDVIVADLFHPARDGAGSLYTLEHFKALRALLRPGGVFCQWLPLYQLDLDTLRLLTRTFLAAFPEGQAFLAHYSLKAPIVGLIARSGTTGYPPDWFQERLQDPELGAALRRVRLYDEFSLLGAYLAGAGELRAFAGPGALNTDNHPLVTFRAPGFVYGTPEPADRRLLQLVRSFNPQPTELLVPPMGGVQPDRNRRLSDYWIARNRFIEMGLGVQETDGLRKLLAQVREPLLEIVRQSRDFEAAYNPLLGMAQGLYRVDPPEGDRLLQDLEKANPYRDDAHRMRQSLSLLKSGVAGPGG